MQELKIGISTCPNDTFIYEALAQGRVETPLRFHFVYKDVQTLNEMVQAGELDVAKVSCGVLPSVLERYGLLRSGGAMGYGCGPLLLSSSAAPFDFSIETWLPGKDTTAALLFRFWCERQGVNNPAIHYASFDTLYRALRSGSAQQGVVIHEHRFTWERDGLFLLADLGAVWEEALAAPIPLGCTVVSRDLGVETARAVDMAIAASLRDAWQRTEPVSPYIREWAQIEDDNVILAHIRTFVTPYSADLGADGEKALSTLFAVWARTQGRNFPLGNIFAVS